MTKFTIAQSAKDTVWVNGEFGIFGLRDPDTPESNAQFVFNMGGVASRLWAQNLTGGTVSKTLTLRDDGANTSLAITSTTAAEGWISDLSNTATIASGSAMTLGYVDSGTDSSLDMIQFTFVPDSGGRAAPCAAARPQGAILDSVSTTYSCFGGNIVADLAQTEAQTYQRLGADYTVSNLQVYASANAGSSVTRVFTVRDNGANGNGTVSFVNGETGRKTDTSNTDSMSEGDTLACSVSGHGINDDITIHQIGCDMENSSGYQDLVSCSNGNQQTIGSGGQVTYDAPVGRLNYIGSETQELRADYSIEIKGFAILFESSGGRSGNTTVDVRVNGSTVGTITIGSGDGDGWYATSDGPYFVERDDIITIRITGATAGSSGFWATVLTMAEVGATALSPQADYLPPVQRHDVQSGPLQALGPELQCVRPISDDTLDSWQDQGGGSTNIYQSIDDDPRDDSDYIKSPAEPSSNEYITALGTFNFPAEMPFTVDYAYRATALVGSPTMNLVVTLYEGAGSIASNTHNSIPIGTVIHDRIELTQGEFDTIGDFGNLFVGFRATQA